MPLIQPDDVQTVDQPELVFGFAAPVGSNLDIVAGALEDGLDSREYELETIRVSSFLETLDLESPTPPDDADEYERITCLMDRGNELRHLSDSDEVLALLAAARINGERPNDPDISPYRSGMAYVIRQIKHPGEVIWLRRIYGRAFHLIGVNCARSTRKEYLTDLRGMNEDEAEEVIGRDEGEDEPWGQQLRQAFHRSDVFVELEDHSGQGAEPARRQVQRYLDLLFGEEVISPTKDEYGTYLAQAAALRSVDLSRQVGAAILTKNGEIISAGTNEVPAAGGGQYWGDPDETDARDYKRGRDANTEIKRECLAEVLGEIEEGWDDLEKEEREEVLDEYSSEWGNYRLMNLTEFGRAVHAEMEAILAAGRVGTSVKGCSLYSTTFPCHNCAKHIVASGLTRVTYIEPYPKSEAQRLHQDSIEFAGFREEEAGDEEDRRRVKFEPFVGIAPRRYDGLFSATTPEGQRLKRKDHRGKLSDEALGLRLKASGLSYAERESVAAGVAQSIEILIQEEGD